MALCLFLFLIVELVQVEFVWFRQWQAELWVLLLLSVVAKLHRVLHFDTYLSGLNSVQ